MNSLMLLTHAVREQLGLRGWDPANDGSDVADIVDEQIARHWSQLPTSDRQDRSALARAVLADVTGFGPLQAFLDDPQVEEIWWNRPDRVFVARDGVHELTDVTLTIDQVAHIVERMLRDTGRRLDVSVPHVDAPLRDGGRLHVVIPPITRHHWAVNIRRYTVRPTRVGELVESDLLDAAAAAFLEAAVRSGRTIVVAGATAAGKTTLLSALLGSVPAGERVVSCEEVYELRSDHPDWAAMQTRSAGLEGTGEVPLRALVKESLRMRPSRLVVGEVRQAEALDLLLAANSGVGSLATIHANSCREALLKLCTLPLLAGQNISSAFVTATVASCIHVVVHLHRDAQGRRRLSEIVETTGKVSDGVVEVVTRFHRDSGHLVQRAA